MHLVQELLAVGLPKFLIICLHDSVTRSQQQVLEQRMKTPRQLEAADYC